MDSPSARRSVPFISFPGFEGYDMTLSEPQEAPDLLTKLQPLLVNSDALECNSALSCFIKESVEGLYGLSTIDDKMIQLSLPSKQNYLQISLFALRLVKLNMFVRNLSLSVGKILGLLSALTSQKTPPHLLADPLEIKLLYETNCLKEFLCIIILLLLKTQPESTPQDGSPVLELLQQFNFSSIIFPFLNSTLSDDNASNQYFQLKFGCDIIFEYLYRMVSLNDEELSSLSQSNLIDNLISHLLLNDNFNNYDMDDDEDWQDESKVTAFEQFKLLLLLNEQYLMNSYHNPNLENEVFASLLNNSKDSSNNISQFMNLTICYLNREESHIIKVLILKFLYLVFTTSFMTKQFYMNDLKILIDIFIRELKNLDYSDLKIAQENLHLAMAYLKVLYPLLMFSQLSEIDEGYKSEEIIDLLHSLIVDTGNQIDNTEETAVVAKLSTKCLNVPWLKKINQANNSPYSNNPPSSSSSSLSSSNKSNSNPNSNSVLQNRPHLYDRNENPSQESIGAQFTRIASVRTSTKGDFHRSTDSHNSKLQEDMVMANNHNIFYGTGSVANNISIQEEQQRGNILHLPQEYLLPKPRSTSKRRPPPPPPIVVPPSKINIKSTPSVGLRQPMIYDKPLPTPPPPPPRRRKAT